MQPDAAVAPKRRAVPLEATALRVARAGPEVLKSDWAGEDAVGKMQLLLFEVCARRSQQVRTKDDLLSDIQELARQRLSADERAALAANFPESAQRQLLDDTSYALQMAAYAVGKPPPPTLHWQHRRSETVKLIALMAALLLVGGLVVASVAAFGVVTAPVWLTALLLGRAWLYLRQQWRQQRADVEADTSVLGPDLHAGLINGAMVEPNVNEQAENGDLPAASDRSSHMKAN